MASRANKPRHSGALMPFPPLHGRAATIRRAIGAARERPVLPAAETEAPAVLVPPGGLC
jgi:hypothetical protein